MLQRQVEGQHLLGDVRQRQIGELAIVRLHLDRLVGAAPGRPDEIAMGQLDALRRAGRSRGVDERRDIVRPLRRDAPPKFGQRRLAGRLAQLEQAAPGDDRRVAGGGGGDGRRLDLTRVEEHDRPQPRRPAARRKELRQGIGVVGDCDRRLGVIEHVGALLGSVGDEDAGGDRPRGDGGEIGDRPLGPVRREDGEPRPRHHAELHEAGRGAKDLIAVVAPRGRHPAVGGAMRLGRAIPELHCGALERRDHRRLGGCLHGPGTLAPKAPRRKARRPRSALRDAPQSKATAPGRLRTGRRHRRGGRGPPRCRRRARSRR